MLKENVMVRDTLTGSRIRERRVMQGLKQTELAKRADISASYLNLIEHNRRRIGGKLLLDIADILNVSPNLLSEGAEAALIATLREAVSAQPGTGAELDRVDEFAGRFPGWAALLGECRHRIDTLERTIATLSDRMTHDPHLAQSLHEMLSTVTSIRSTASILAEPGEVEPEWQARFHRNIHEDSARLADSSRALVTYLEAAGDAGADITVPQEEVDAVLSLHEYRIPGIERPGADADALTADLGGALSDTARGILADILRRMVGDAQALPQQTMVDAIADLGLDPLALAERLGADVPRIMRRLTTLPSEVLPAAVGLAVCDSAGALTYRRPVADFQMPRFGAGCPFWPLYQALSHPMTPIVADLAMAGRAASPFRSFAIAQPATAFRIGRPVLFEAHMLLVATEADPGRPPLPVGVTCRICPHTDCEGRREPSILTDGM